MIGINLKLETELPEEEGTKTTWSDDLLGSTLQKKWQMWSTIRRQIEEEWLQDLRAFNQQNEPDAEKLSKFHSHIYIGLTRTKCVSAYSRISDLMFQSRDSHWGIEPTPVPEDEANDPVNAQFIDAMQARAEAMQTEIEDQLIDLHYEDYVKAAILEACILGTGCVKGVIPSVKKIEKWGFIEAEWDVIKSEIPAPQISQPSIFDVYPDPYANRVQDMSGVFERHILNRQQFAELKDDARFDEEKIEQILSESATGNHVALWHETTRRSIAKVTDTTATNSERYDVLEYWGQVSGRMLIASGVEDIEESETYWANVWTCSGKTLLAKVMPMKKQRIPYNFFVYNKIPHQFWGIGPAKMGRSSQLGVNGVVRSILDGMAMVAVPMAEVNIHMLKDGQNPAVMAPGQVYLRDSGDPSVPAVRFFQPDIPTGALIQMGEMFKSYADDETALPAYTYGDQGNELNKTASGMSMQMNAASLPIKAVVKNLEDGLIRPLIESLFDWNMQWSDKEEIKGDMTIQVLGTSALMAKEQKAQQLQQFLQITANPLDMQFVDRKYLLQQTAKAMEIDTEKAVPEVMPENPTSQQPNPVDVAKAELIKAQTAKTMAETTVKNVEAQYSSVQAAQTVATIPAVVPIADSLLLSAGYQDANGAPIAEAPQSPAQLPTRYSEQTRINVNTDPRFPPNPENPAVGMMQGIETQGNDGVMQ